MRPVIIMFALLATILTACAPDPRDAACAPISSPATPTTMHWGYYPGYGCGPVPPAVTVFP